MAKYLVLIVVFFLGTSFFQESIYTHTVTTIEGVNKPLSAYQGKRILIITLPVVQNPSNDSLLHSLDSLQAANAGTLIVIAVPSYEDGYTVAQQTTLKNWYRSILSNDVIVTEGMYTRKASLNQQHPLFKWLTDKDRNGYFDRDVAGPRDKFVVWTDGQLIGVLGAPTKLGAAVLQELLQ